MAISLPIGSSNSGTNDWSDVHGNDAQLVTEIDDRDSNYQTLLFAKGIVDDTAAGAATRLLGSKTGGAASTMMQGTGGSQTVAGVDAVPPDFIYFDDADYLLTSKTQKLRVRAQVLTNATAPAITFTIGFYPFTIAGSADSLAYTVGTVTTGSTVAHASPSASTITQSNSGDFTIPADGGFVLGVVISGSPASNSATAVHAQLQTRWV